MEFKLEDQEFGIFNLKLRRYERRFKKELKALRDEYAQRMLQQTIANASGRPGPNVITGQYISSFVTTTFDFGDEGFGLGVFNSSPQTYRLEYGFVGTDSLGRNYNQPAFPHMRPALIVVGAEFQEDLASLPAKVWNSL